MELDSLKFNVDTTDLVTAVGKVKELRTAISQLNTPVQRAVANTAKLAKEELALAKNTEKLNQEKAKTATLEAKATAAKDKAALVTERLTKATKEQQSVLERQQSILEFMTQGYSKGQASTLAMAQANGALADELKQVGEILKTQRQLIGGDPFDKSTAGLISMTNQLRELQYEYRLVNEGVQLTSKQYKELARDQLRITETSIAAGLSFEQMSAKLDENKRNFIETASAINVLTAAEKERERNQRDVLNAQRAVAREDEKIESILRSLNIAEQEHVSITERATRSIANYERNLRLAGISGEEAAKKLQMYRSTILQVTAAEEKRKVDMLSRALAPQISDVVVSLAGGMNPMTVLLQQGLQVRDLIGLSGVAVQDLQVAFKTAASDMVTSIAGTAKALNSLFIGAITDAGSAVLRFGGQITGTNSLLDVLRAKMLATGAASSGLISIFDNVAKTLRILTGVGVAGVILGFAAFLLSLRDVIKEERELNIALNTTGAAFGLTQTSANEYAKSLESIGISTSSAIKAIVQIAKNGIFAKDAIDDIVVSATFLEKRAGISIEETVKNFAKLRDEPVKAVLELGKQTGYFSEELLNNIVQLEQQGRTTEAARLAMREYAKETKASADRIVENYGVLEGFAMTIGGAFKSMWDAILGVGRKEDNVQVLERQLKVAKELAAGDTTGFYQMEVEKLESSLRAINNMKQEAAIRQSNAEAAQNMNYFEQLRLRSESASQKYQRETNTLIQKEQDLLAKGQLTAEQAILISREKARLEKDYLKAITEQDKKAPKSNTERESERVKKLMMGLKDQSQDFNKDFTRNWNDVALAASKYGYSVQDVNNAYAELLKQQPVVKAQMDAEEASLKAIEEIKARSRDLNDQLLQQQQSSNLSIFEANKALEEEIELMGLDAQQREQLLRLKTEQAIADKRLALIWEQSVPGNEARVKLLEEEIRLLERGLELRGQRATRTLEVAQEEEAKKLKESVADAIVTGLFEGGKAGSKKLRDIIEAELHKPVVLFVQALVNTLFGGSSGGGITGGAGVIGNISNAWNMISGIGSGVGNSVAFGADSIGNWLVNNTSGSLNRLGGSLMGNAGTLGNLGSMFGNAMTGNALYKGISGGYSISKGLDIAGNIASLFGPIYGAIGGAINRLFGRKLKDTGIEGTFGGESGFTGNTYQFLKGGLLRSNKTVRGALDEGLRGAFANAYQEMSASLMSMANLLNLNTDALDNFKTSIKFSTNGLNETQIQEKITKVFGKVGEKQARLLLGTYETTTSRAGLFGRMTTSTTWKPGDFVREQETALEALQRLASSISAVNSVLKNMNATMLDFSLVGADMASSLVDLFGGLENFQSALGQYYEQYFTQEEKLANLSKVVSESFANLNLEVPKTIKEYRDLVDAQNLTTQAGRETFTALIGISPVFYEVANAITEVTSSIIDEVKRLRGEILKSSPSSSLAALQSQFAINTAAARAGDTAAITSLPEISQAIEEAVRQQATSAADIVRIQAWLANSLSETSGILGSPVPAFASGGLHSGGLRLVGEHGPELEVTGPSRIFSAGQTAGMLNGEGLKELISEVQMLRAEVRADVLHNAKTAKLLDRVIPEGDSIRISGEVTTV